MYSIRENADSICHIQFRRAVLLVRSMTVPRAAFGPWLSANFDPGKRIIAAHPT